MQKKKNCSYFKISNQTGENVPNVFLTLTMKYLDILANKSNTPKGKNPPTPHIAKLERPKWIPDEDRTNCKRCEQGFSVTKRRHHCRNCGEIYCSSCSSKLISIPRFGYIKPVRVCMDCYQLLTS